MNLAYTLHANPYPYTVWLYIGDRGDCRAELLAQGIDIGEQEHDAGEHHWLAQQSMPWLSQSIIWMPTDPFAGTCDDVKYLRHELLHAAWRILSAVGVRLSADNHEALAYLIDYLEDQAREQLCKAP